MPACRRVVAGDQADVAASDHEETLRGADQVAVDQGLERARPVDAGQRVAREDQRLLAGAGGDEKDVGPDDEVLTVAQDAHPAIGEHREHRRVEPDADVLECAHILLEPGRDVDAARAGMARLDRAEELVRLEDELAAQAVLVVDDERADASLAQLDAGSEPGRAAADDQALHVHGLNRVHARLPVDVGQGGQPVEGPDVHARADDDHARLDRQAVGDDGALGALAVGAENALRRAVLVMVPERADAAGEKGGGDRFALARLQRPPLPRKRHVGRPGRSEDRVFENAVIGHGDDSWHDTAGKGSGCGAWGARKARKAARPRTVTAPCEGYHIEQRTADSGQLTADS